MYYILSPFLPMAKTTSKTENKASKIYCKKHIIYHRTITSYRGQVGLLKKYDNEYIDGTYKGTRNKTKYVTYLKRRKYNYPNLVAICKIYICVLNL